MEIKKQYMVMGETITEGDRLELLTKDGIVIGELVEVRGLGLTILVSDYDRNKLVTINTNNLLNIEVVDD